MNTFMLKCGIALPLKMVSPDAIRNLIADRDMDALINRWETLGDGDAVQKLENELDTPALLKINRGTTRLFNYCIGFGVDYTPPQEEIDELGAMGFSIETPRIALVNWLRYLKLDGAEEAGELVGMIMALSIHKEQRETSEEEKLRARIAELELQAGSE